MNLQEEAAQAEQQFIERRDQIASQDPACMKLYGRLELLRELIADEDAQPELEIAKEETS